MKLIEMCWSELKWVDNCYWGNYDIYWNDVCWYVLTVENEMNRIKWMKIYWNDCVEMCWYVLVFSVTWAAPADSPGCAPSTTVPGSSPGSSTTAAGSPDWRPGLGRGIFR